MSTVQEKLDTLAINLELLRHHINYRLKNLLDDIAKLQAQTKPKEDPHL